MDASFLALLPWSPTSDSPLGEFRELVSSCLVGVFEWGNEGALFFWVAISHSFTSHSSLHAAWSLGPGNQSSPLAIQCTMATGAHPTEHFSKFPVMNPQSLMFIFVFLSTHNVTSGTNASERVGWHMFLVKNFLTRDSNKDIVSHVTHVPMRHCQTFHKFFQLRLVNSKRLAHRSGIAGALHLEGGYWHELTIFMT